jgi:hypothetical protein
MSDARSFFFLFFFFFFFFGYIYPALRLQTFRVHIARYMHLTWFLGRKYAEKKCKKAKLAMA